MMKQVFKKTIAIGIIAVLGAAVLTGCGCKKREVEDDLTDAMKVFVTGEISKPKQLTATLVNGDTLEELDSDIAVLQFETPKEVSALDAVKRKDFGKDGKLPMPQITEFEVYIQTDCNIDDTGFHWNENWDTYEWDGASGWGEDIDSYVGWSDMPYEAETLLTGGNTVPYEGEYEVSCLDYLSETEPSFVDMAVIEAEDGSLHYDLENHTVLYRHRFVIKYTESGEQKVIISDWSDGAWLVPEALGTEN